MWIFAECAYQHWIAEIGAPVTVTDFKKMIAHSAQAAIFVNEAFNLYSHSGAAQAYKALRAWIPTAAETPAALAEEVADRAQEGHMERLRGRENVATYTGDEPLGDIPDDI